MPAFTLFLNLTKNIVLFQEIKRRMDIGVSHIAYALRYVTSGESAAFMALGQHKLGHQLGAVQNKGVGAGQKALHGAVGEVGDFGVFRYVGQVRADETERLRSNV